MKSLRLSVCALALMLSGCSTLSSINWSAANPWNWFGSSTQVTEQGVGGITSSTALDEKAIGDALGSDYRLRSGMRVEKGNIIRYFEALKGDNVALIVNGESGTVNRVDVLDSDIETAKGTKIGTPFSDLYDKAFGQCAPGTGDDSKTVECKTPESQHISLVFTGEWHGPEGLMPSDDALKSWKLHKIIWRR
jgi:hypothetical protein